MVKSRPRKNQSECSDLPCHIILLITAAIYVILPEKNPIFDGIVHMTMSDQENLTPEQLSLIMGTGLTVELF